MTIFSTTVFLCALIGVIGYWDFRLRLHKVIGIGPTERFLDSKASRIGSQIMAMITTYMGFQFIRNTKAHDLPKHAMIVSNHQSLLDIPAIVASFPHHNIRFVAKNTLFSRVPMITPVLRYQRHAGVFRTGKFSDTSRNLDQFAKRIAVDARCPVVFPEGTRSKSGSLGKFHAGAFRKIMRVNPLPVIVVGVSGGHLVSDLKRVLNNIRNGSYTVNVLSVHDAPVGREAIDALFERVCAEITMHHASIDSHKKKPPIKGDF